MYVKNAEGQELLFTSCVFYVSRRCRRSGIFFSFYILCVLFLWLFLLRAFSFCRNVKGPGTSCIRADPPAN